MFSFLGQKIGFTNIYHTLEDFSKFDPPFKSTVFNNNVNKEAKVVQNLNLQGKKRWSNCQLVQVEGSFRSLKSWVRNRGHGGRCKGGGFLKLWLNEAEDDEVVQSHCHPSNDAACLPLLYSIFLWIKHGQLLHRLLQLEPRGNDETITGWPKGLCRGATFCFDFNT